MATRCCCPPDIRSGYSCGLLCQAEAREQRHRLFFGLLARLLEHLYRRQGYVLQHGHVGEQVVALEYDTDVTPQGIHIDARPGDTVAMDQDLPSSMGSRPLIQRSKVDLPDPEGPIRHTTWCFSTVMLRRSMTGNGPYDLEIRANFDERHATAPYAHAARMRARSRFAMRSTRRTCGTEMMNSSATVVAADRL